MHSTIAAKVEPASSGSALRGSSVRLFVCARSVFDARHRLCCAFALHTNDFFALFFLLVSLFYIFSVLHLL